MKKYIRTLTVFYDTEISYKEIPLFRGAVLKSMGDNADLLYHNHAGEGSLRYSYPLIQYKRLGGRAAIVCAEDGVDTIGQFFAASDGELRLGHREVKCSVGKIVPARVLVQTWSGLLEYRINRWLPLNAKNYQIYRMTDDENERKCILENILKANLLSMLKGLGIHLEEELRLSIANLGEPHIIYNKGVGLMAFNANFTCNLSIPDNLGIGKNASIGYGVVYRNKKQNEEKNMCNGMKYDKLFVGGDLSGIQKFLYNITSRHASVSLKGRSEYLRREMHELYKGIQKVITDAGGIITEEDKLYCSGGKFYLATNNTPAVAKAIDDFARKKEEEFWREHRGGLGINISYIAYGTGDNKFYVEGHDDEENTTSGVLWKYLNANFARQKNQKFKNLIKAHANRFFSFDTEHEDSKELIVGSDHKVCALTGVEFDPSIYGDEKCKIDDDDLFYLPSAVEQIKIGKDLRQEENFKTFEEYATADNGETGDSYLGILRMDVDGMGKKFIIGFPTLEKYKEFSERVKKFFEDDIQEKFLKEKCDENHTYKEYINVIYAGGDDLCIVGRWDKVIDFAKYIHDKTEEAFKGDGYKDKDMKEEHYISISGGIAIVNPKFPIAKAADMAGEAEEAAKRGEKNAFTMFGRTVSWKTDKDEHGQVKPLYTINGQTIKHEFDYVKYFKDRFVEYITRYNDNYGFNRSILHKIMLYSELADLNKDREFHGRPLNYSYIWHMSYYLTRYMEKWKDNKESDEEKRKVKNELYNFCKNLRDEHLAKQRNLELMAMAARWAELLLRR